MASYLKNLLPFGGNWSIEMMAEETVHFEPYLYDDDNQSQENGQAFKLPEVVGILPIRNAVAYPGTIMPLAIGRKKSKALLADTEPIISFQSEPLFQC